MAKRRKRRTAAQKRATRKMIAANRGGRRRKARTRTKSVTRWRTRSAARPKRRRRRSTRSAGLRGSIQSGAIVGAAAIVVGAAAARLAGGLVKSPLTAALATAFVGIAAGFGLRKAGLRKAATIAATAGAVAAGSNLAEYYGGATIARYAAKLPNLGGLLAPATQAALPAPTVAGGIGAYDRELTVTRTPVGDF